MLSTIDRILDSTFFSSLPHDANKLSKLSDIRREVESRLGQQLTSSDDCSFIMWSFLAIRHSQHSEYTRKDLTNASAQIMSFSHTSWNVGKTTTNGEGAASSREARVDADKLRSLFTLLISLLQPDISPGDPGSVHRTERISSHWYKLHTILCVLERYIAEDVTVDRRIRPSLVRGGICTMNQVKDCILWAAQEENETALRILEKALKSTASSSELAEGVAQQDLFAWLAQRWIINKRRPSVVTWFPQTTCTLLQHASRAESTGGGGSRFQHEIEDLARFMGLVRWGDPSCNAAESAGLFVGKFFDPLEPNHFVTRNTDSKNKVLRHVFRSLSAEDTVLLQQKGLIMCKKLRSGGKEWAGPENLDESALQHVCNGGGSLFCGEWVSSTKNMGSAIKFSGVLHDLALISIQDIHVIKDLEDKDVTGQILRRSNKPSEEKMKVITYTTRSKEVLIHKQAPSENIQLLSATVQEVKIWPFDYFKEGGRDQMLDDMCLRQALLQDLRSRIGIPSDPEGDKIEDLFPGKQFIGRRFFKLERTIGGPNDRMSLVTFTNKGHMLHGVSYVLKQAQPNLKIWDSDSEPKLVSDEHMRLQLRISWVANAIYCLLADSKSCHISTPKCCLYEYSASFADFICFKYTDDAKPENRDSVNVWNGSFLLCRYDEDTTERLRRPPCEAEAVVEQSKVAIFLAQQLPDLVADCLTGVSLKHEGQTVLGTLTGEEFVFCNSKGLLIRLPIALQHAMGCTLFHTDNDSFRRADTTLKFLEEKLSQTSEPYSTEAFDFGFLKSNWKRSNGKVTDWKLERVLQQLVLLLDHSSQPSLLEAGCRTKFASNFKDRCLIINKFQERVPKSNLQKSTQNKKSIMACIEDVKKNHHRNRIALLYADPLIESSDDDKNIKCFKSDFCGAVSQNYTQSLLVGRALESLSEIKPDLHLQICTLDTLKNTASNFDLIILSAHIELPENDDLAWIARLRLESKLDNGAADYVELDRGVSKRLDALSRAMAKFLRHDTKFVAQFDGDQFIGVQAMLACINKEKSVPYLEKEVKRLIEVEAFRFSIKMDGGEEKIRANSRHSRKNVQEERICLGADSLEGTSVLICCEKSKWAQIETHGRITSSKMIKLLHFGAGDVDHTCSSNLQRTLSSETDAERSSCYEAEILILIDVQKALKDGVEFFKFAGDKTWIFTDGETKPENSKSLKFLSNRYFLEVRDKMGNLIKDYGATLDSLSLFPRVPATLMSRLNRTTLKLLLILQEGSLGTGVWAQSMKSKLEGCLSYHLVIADGSPEHLIAFSSAFCLALAGIDSVQEAIRIAARRMKDEKGVEIHEEFAARAHSGIANHQVAGARSSLRLMHIAPMQGFVNIRPLLLTNHDEGQTDKVKDGQEPEQNQNGIPSSDIPSLPVYGRQRDLFEIIFGQLLQNESGETRLGSVGSKVVNVWGPDQCDKSSLAFELERYCKHRGQFLGQVRRVELEKYLVTSSDLLRLIFYNSEKSEKSSKGCATADTVDLNNCYSESWLRLGGFRIPGVHLVIIDAGPMEKELLLQVFKSSLLFKEIEESGIKVVLFSNEKLDLMDLSFTHDSYRSVQIQNMDRYAAERYFHDERRRCCNSLQNQSHMQYRGLSTVAEVGQAGCLPPVLTRLWDSLFPSCTSRASPMIIRLLALLPENQLKKLLSAAVNKSPAAEDKFLLECLFSCLGPDLRYALLACSTLPNLFSVDYIKGFEFWQKECWINFFVTDKSLNSMFPQSNAGASETFYNWMLSSGTLGNSIALVSGKQLLDVLINRGFITQCSGGWLSLPEDVRTFCREQTKVLSSNSSFYENTITLQKKTAIRGLIRHFQIASDCSCGNMRKEFKLHWKSWKWATDEILVRCDNLDKRLNEEMSEAAVQEFLVWVSLFSDLFWAVRHFIKDSLSAETGKKIEDMLHIQSRFQPTVSFEVSGWQLAQARCRFVKASIQLDEFNVDTYTPCILELNTIVETLGEVRDDTCQMERTLRIEALFLQGVVHSWMARDSAAARNQPRSNSSQSPKVTGKKKGTLQTGSDSSLSRNRSFQESASHQSPHSNTSDTSRHESDSERLSRLSSEFTLNSGRAVSYFSDALSLLHPFSVDHNTPRQLLALYVNIKAQLRTIELRSDQKVSIDSAPLSSEIVAWMKDQMPNEYLRWLCDQAAQVQQQAEAAELDPGAKNYLLLQADQELHDASEHCQGLLDFSSFKSLLNLCDICVKRIELRTKMQAGKGNDGWVNDYESRRQAFHLLKHLQKISKVWNGGKDPPPRFGRIWTLEKRLKRSGFFSNGKLQLRALASAGVKALTEGGEAHDLACFSGDLFDHWEAYKYMYMLAREFLTAPGPAGIGMRDMLGGFAYVFRAALGLSARDPGGGRSVVDKLGGLLRAWDEGCPHEELEAPVRSDPDFDAAEPLLKALFCPLPPSEELHLLCACLTATLYRRLTADGHGRGDAAAGEAGVSSVARCADKRQGLTIDAVFGSKRTKALPHLRQLVFIWKAVLLTRPGSSATPVSHSGL